MQPLDRRFLGDHEHSTDDLTEGELDNTRLPPRLSEYVNSGVVADVTDWNDAIKSGWYRGGAAALNQPDSGQWGLGFVQAVTSVYLTQTVHSYGLTSSTNSKTWQRSCINGSWQAWTKVYLFSGDYLGAIYGLLDGFLTATKVLISDSNGRIATSEVTPTELNYLAGVTTNLQNQLNAKQATLTGATSGVTTSNLAPSVVVITDASGKLAVHGNVSGAEVGYLDGVTSAIQTQLNGKQATITGAATTIDTEDLNPDLVVVSGAGGKIATSGITTTEVGYLDGVTSAIQTQMNDKQESDEPQDLILNNIGATGSAQNLDLSLYNYFKIEPTANLTLTFTNDAIGSACIVELTGGGDHTLTWSGATFSWDGGSAPDLATGTNICQLSFVWLSTTLVKGKLIWET